MVQPIWARKRVVRIVVEEVIAIVEIVGGGSIGYRFGEQARGGWREGEGAPATASRWHMESQDPKNPLFPKHQSPLVILFYLVSSVVLTWPLARNFASMLPSVFVSYDALLQVFLLGWGWEGLTTSPLAVFNAPIFYPELRTLTYMDHMLGEAVLAGPVIEMFGLGAGYNALVVFSFVASGYFVYRLARLYGISRSGSCLAGFLFAFCPYRFSHLGALNQLQTQFIPLGLFFAVQFVRTERIAYGIGAALTLSLQSYFGWYSTFHLCIALAVLLGWHLTRERGGWRRMPWRKVAWLGLMSAILAMPGVVPYILQSTSMPEYDRPFSETVRCSADLLDYVRVNPENILGRFIQVFGAWPGFFPGLVATGLSGLAIFGLWQYRSNPGAREARLRKSLRERARSFRRLGEIGYLVVLGGTGFILSLGPLLHVAGERLWVPLPYMVLYYIVPGFSSMRTPGRFAVLVSLAAAVLAGVGFDMLRRRHPKLGLTLLAGTLLVAGILAWSPDLPFVPVPDRATMPPVYAWLEAQPDAKPVLELPVPLRDGLEGDRHVRRQMYVLYHKKPRLDGASGFTSERYDVFRRAMQSFPSPESIRGAYDMGARRLVVHYGDYRPSSREWIREQVERSEALGEVAAFGEDVVYEIAEPQ